MTYLDAWHDTKTDLIRVTEVTDNGGIALVDYPVEQVFYVETPNGQHRTLRGKPCKKRTFKSTAEYRKEIAIAESQSKKLHEANLNPVFRLLSTVYKDQPVPKLDIGFVDIEADFCKKRGYAKPDDPFNPITAITVKTTRSGVFWTLALVPDAGDAEHFQNLVSDIPDTMVFSSEADMLEAFLDLIQPIHVLSGWNSSGYDIPYLVNRCKRLKLDITRFCIGGKEPIPRTFKDKYNREIKSFDLVGRGHLDYIDLYRKHVPQQRQSYKLDFIGEIEVGVKKIAFEGDLGNLWRADFKKFVEYNRRDVELLFKIDAKLGYIDLSNEMAHDTGVLLKTTVRAVAMTQQAIINEAHSRNLIVPSKAGFNDSEEDEDTGPVAGAYVTTPVVGLHKHIGVVDLNSLYPSTIRALNMGPETLVGQIRCTATEKYVADKSASLPANQRADAWEDIFCVFELDAIRARGDEEITIDFEDSPTETRTAAEWYEIIFNPQSNLCVSANGTIFRTDIDGVIPSLLGRWYSERKSLQALEKDYEHCARGIEISEELAGQIRNSELSVGMNQSLDELSLLSAIAENNVRTIRALMDYRNLILAGTTILSEIDSNKQLLNEKEKEYNRKQQVKKISLNIIYGSLLNRGLIFYDARIGQSVTLTGRSIVRHQSAQVNLEITGEYDHKGKSILYGDTDSSFFSAFSIGYGGTKEDYIGLYDEVTRSLNTTFVDFMVKDFAADPNRAQVIRAGRESVSSTGLFIKKKKYALMVYDKEGTRLDVNGKPGKLKITGLDMKRADTPEYMQNFLTGILADVLAGATEKDVIQKIADFRLVFKPKPGWEKGLPKKVSDLSGYQEKIDAGVRGFEKMSRMDSKTLTIPEHVKAAMNWNRLVDIHDDKRAERMVDGMRIVVCKLKPNVHRMTAIAYPVDQAVLPEWFKELPFDHAMMEDKVIDNKIGNLLDVMGWNLAVSRETTCEFFTFGA